MRNTFRLLVLCALALLVSLPLAAQMVPESSTLPIDVATDVGGTVLQPGTYTITSIAESKDRSVVKISSPDNDKVYATVITVPHHMEAKDTKPNTEFVYYPAGEGQPRALRTWYPSDPVRKYDAYDIVYTESRAKQLARIAKGEVISYRDQVAVADLGTTELHRVTPEAKVEIYTPPAPATITTTTVTEAPNVTMPEETTQIAESRPMELPRTASNVPLMALVGLLAVGAAAAIRIAR